MRVNSLVPHHVVKRFQFIVSRLHVLLECLHRLHTRLILGEGHIVGNDDILEYFSLDFVEIALVEEPMLRENLFALEISC